MQLVSIASLLALAIGVTAVPLESGIVKLKQTAACDAAYERATLFETWTTESWPLDAAVCPLNSCTVTVFSRPVCDDYSYDGAWRDQLGCIWTGGALYRSYKVDCNMAA
ncbi:hypothetical protein QBC40DRAFT_269205 [Triangularia verruculosa]|uniref:Uncharacterized protein n=1 Tax=Triangularia verruculosa TaxID=2587418 RepID=A0AAN6X8P8_9PEZI|nr:hypothetical protein QBC40DRAFT_269205 [Triangularia verruculosa]